MIPSWSSPYLYYHKNSQFSSKITNFGHQISLGNNTLYCKDRHPLLLDCFPTSLRYVRMIDEPLAVYQFRLWPTQCLFYQKNSQFSSKITKYGHQINLGNVTPCCKDRHPLLLKCFPTSLRCIWVIARTSGSIYDPLMVVTISLLPQKLSIFKQNN